MKLKFNIVSISFSLLVLFQQWKLGEAFTEEEIQFINDLFTGVKLRKCNCNANQVWDETGNCKDSPRNTTVPIIIDVNFLQPFEVETNFFEVIENSNLQCGTGERVTSLATRDLMMLPSGLLYHMSTNRTFSPLHYCLNHLDELDGVPQWEVRICLNPPKVPICCGLKNKRNLDPRCRNPNPTIWYGFSPLRNPFIMDVQREDLTCKEDQIVQKLPLSYPRVYINNIQDEPLLSVEEKEYQAKDFCISPGSTKGDYKALICITKPLLEHQRTCENSTCVRKCCPNGLAMNSDLGACSDVNETDLWNPVFRDTGDQSDVEAPENLKLVIGFPLCTATFSLKVENPEDYFFLLNNGSIFLPKMLSSIPSSRYCVDNFVSQQMNTSQQALVCFPDNPAEISSCDRIKDIVFPILQIISCIFLLITLIVYATIPELHAKLHGKSLISHVSALFAAYLSMSIMTLNSGTVEINLCRTMAIVIQFSFLGAFFWLNVMCFDIWWTLRSMRPVAETSESFRRRFMLYSMYAWGCPLIIVVVTCGMEMLPPKDYPNLILPGFGNRNCWFQSAGSTWFYFYSFVSVLTLVNIFFFICVAVILIQAQRANNSILRTTNKQHKERVWIYLKLFVVMGITWICELISWREGSCEYWFFTDVVNSLQGFFIFLIFICKRTIFAKLRTRGTDSTRKIKRMVQGSSSYGSSSQVSQQTSLDSSRKLSSSLHYHLSRLNKDNIINEEPKKINA